MTVGKKLRFEVFKRDKFTCQYCGQKAPDVVLHLDHVVPRADGGDDDMLNLVTSCVDCNLGKGARRLDDDTVIVKQRRQLETLQLRREQLEMMMDWQRGLIDQEAELVENLGELWSELVPSYSLTENGSRSVAAWVTRYGYADVVRAMRLSTNQYLVFEEGPDLPTAASVEKAFGYVPRIIVSEQRMQEKPYLRDLYYIRGILRNRLDRTPEWESLALMERAVLAGATTEQIKAVALRVSRWSAFCEDVEELCGET